MTFQELEEKYTVHFENENTKGMIRATLVRVTEHRGPNPFQETTYTKHEDEICATSWELFEAELIYYMRNGLIGEIV